MSNFECIWNASSHMQMFCNYLNYVCEAFVSHTIVYQTYFGRFNSVRAFAGCIPPGTVPWFRGPRQTVNIGRVSQTIWPQAIRQNWVFSKIQSSFKNPIFREIPRTFHQNRLEKRRVWHTSANNSTLINILQSRWRSSLQFLGQDWCRSAEQL